MTAGGKAAAGRGDWSIAELGPSMGWVRVFFLIFGGLVWVGWRLAVLINLC